MLRNQHEEHEYWCYVKGWGIIFYLVPTIMCWYIKFVQLSDACNLKKSNEGK